MTFLSIPGQGYQDCLGSSRTTSCTARTDPIAAVFLPIYRGSTCTRRTSTWAAGSMQRRGCWGRRVFLLQRGLPAGITIYVPATILLTVLHWCTYADDPAHGDGRDRLHGRGRQPGSERDAKVPARRDLLRDARGLRRPARPDAARGRARPRPGPGRRLSQAQRGGLLDRREPALYLLVGHARRSWPWPTSAPTSRRSSATFRGPRSARAGSA